MEEMDGAGVDTAVAEPISEIPETPAESPKVKEETPDEVAEETPEQVEERDRENGSRRKKAQLARKDEEIRILREQNDLLKQQVVPQAPKPAETPAATGEPKLGDYLTFSEYNTAEIDYRVQKAIQEREAKQQQAQVMQSWEAKKAEARKTIPDFDEVLADMNPPAPVVLAVMNESPFTFQIAHYLGNNPDEAAEINKMSPAKAALAIGEIAATFKAPKPTEKKETKAPPPLVPVKAAAIAVKNDRYAGLEEY
jgi:hypothetical protein